MNSSFETKRNRYTWFFYVLFSVSLIIADYNNHLSTLRAQANSLTIKIFKTSHALISWPSKSAKWVSDQFVNQNKLLSTINALEKENLLLKGRMQELVANKLHIERYKRLFDFAYQVKFDRFLFVNILGEHNSFLKNQLIINKGTKHHVYAGQPIINHSGIIGQVSEVGWNSSFVTLITHPNHSIPVETKNGNIQGILRGNGQNNPMKLDYIAQGNIINVGSVLYSSGQGHVFPRGYPVAKVSRIQPPDNNQFLGISAQPNSNLSNTTEALLIWPKQ